MRTIVKRPIEEFENFTRNIYMYILYIYMFNAIARGINKSGGQVNERAAINPNGVTSVVRLSDHRKIVPVTSVQVWQNANERSGSMCPML